jgi:hypothetical protein
MQEVLKQRNVTESWTIFTLLSLFEGKCCFVYLHFKTYNMRSQLLRLIETKGICEPAIGLNPKPVHCIPPCFLRIHFDIVL